MYNGIITAKAEYVEHLQHLKSIKVEQVDEYPYSAVGILKVFKNGEFLGHGTGSLIGPNLVLTAGHNCYPKGLNL